jgi:macrodomain Ter protein organizer (MatP/YcbG family)
MKRTNIYLSEIQWKKLVSLSKKMDLSVSELIRRFIDEGLEKYEEKGVK